MTSSVDFGLALLSLEKCHRVTTSKGFQILEGEKGLASFLPGKVPADFLSLFGEEERKQLTRETQRLKQQEVASCTLKTLEGVPLELLVIRREQGLEILCRDITDRLQSLERLALFYRYFLTTPIAVCITDAEANIIEANRSFLDFYGYRLEDIRGKNPRILKSGRQSPAAYSDMWQQITDPKSGHWTDELINRKSNGEEVTVMLSVSAVRKTNGTLLGYIASALDLSRQKWLEQDLRDFNEKLNESNQLKSELMAITSHDLKSPVHAIMSRAALLKETLPSLSPEKLNEQLDKIIAAGKKMGEFIDDLLDLEKAESGRVQFETMRLHLDALIRSCIETIQPSAIEKEIEIKYRLEGQSRPLRADRLKLEQVFMNLLSNAVKFSPQGSEINIVCYDEGSSKHVDIIDQGPGIPTEDIDGIFDRFSQVRKKGAVSKRAHGVGLGLNIVQKYIEMHNGKVSVVNGPEQGCHFKVELSGCDKVHSGTDLAAVILDPANEILNYVEVPLKSKGVCCYVCKTPEELRRTMNFERPEIVFVHQESLTAEIEATLSELGIATSGTEPFLININTGKGLLSNKEQYFQSLQTPIVEIEILTLLNEIMAQMNG